LWPPRHGPRRHQTTDPPLHRLEVAAGHRLSRRRHARRRNADLRSATSTGPYRLFTTSTELTGTTVIELRAGSIHTPLRLSRPRALFGHPEVRTDISGDAENAPPITAVERLDHYLIDGGIVVRLDEFRFKGLRPFVTAGAGYLRQLHEGLTVIETGQVFYVGGGARYMIFMRPRGVPRAGGLRGDVRLNVLTGGIEIEDRRRRSPPYQAASSCCFSGVSSRVMATLNSFGTRSEIRVGDQPVQIYSLPALERAGFLASRASRTR
jgi:hypothetical protein